jgi:hypothetical protein
MLSLINSILTNFHGALTRSPIYNLTARHSLRKGEYDPRSGVGPEPPNKSHEDLRNISFSIPLLSIKSTYLYPRQHLFTVSSLQR